MSILNTIELHDLGSEPTHGRLLLEVGPAGVALVNEEHPDLDAEERVEIELSWSELLRLADAAHPIIRGLRPAAQA